MQTVGLTTTIAATDAGADSAAQTKTAAAGAPATLFDVLMAAAVTKAPPGTPGATDAAALPVDPATQALATDMEQMVSALAITADVVAKGMAARTTPVREIILKVEAPAADAPVATDGMPDLTVLAPTDVDPALEIKITTAAPQTDASPDLIAHVMQQHAVIPADPITEAQAATAVTDAAEAPVAEVDVADAVTQTTALQPHLETPATDIPQGPWRVEAHGPFIDAQQALQTAPVYQAEFEAPAPAPLPVPHDVLEQVPAAPVAPQTPAPVANIPVLTIKVRTVAAADPAMDEISSQEDVSTIVEDVKDPAAETDTSILATPILPTADFAATATIIVSHAPVQPADAAKAHAENEPHDPLLDHPRQQQDDAEHALPQRHFVPTSEATEGGTHSVVTVLKPVTSETGLPSYDEVAEFSEEPHADGNPTPPLPARPQIKPNDRATESETKIANTVANSSSRSSANIRDLIKVGVRDIEIIQSTGSEQASSVNPQVQIIQPDSASLAVRAQAADAFAATGSESANTERRAQAHEIRMRAIERQVIAAAREGTDTIRMQLYPPGLGQVMIRITMDGSRMKLTTRASSAEAAESLRTIEGDLRDALAVGGLELTGFDVSDEGERNDKRREQAEETKTITRSAKSDGFALDMNA